MSLFKHAMVSGINDALVDNGIVAWPNEKVGFEACASVAEDLAGPDMLPTGGLAKESALLIADRLKTAADLLLANGYAPDASTVLRTKQAAQMDFGTRAAVMAEACMSKAASDASLTSVGPNTSESAAATDQHAALDQHNRARNAYLTGVGRTMFPNGGVVGQQMLYPGAPNRASRNSLTALDKQADLSPAARRALIGSGIGLVGGAGAGAALGDEDEMLQNALLGGAAGAGLGAGAGYGYDALMAHRAKKKAPAAAAPPATPEQALAQAAVQSAAAGDVPVRRPATLPGMGGPGGLADFPEMRGGTLPGYKAASADMDAADLTPGATPGALDRSMMFLQGLENMGYQPGAGAQVAAAGLGQAGAPGLEVMAHVLDNAKTAEEIDVTLSQVLDYQEKTGSLADDDLVEAVQYLSNEKIAGGGRTATMAGPGHSLMDKARTKGRDAIHNLKEYAKKVKENPKLQAMESHVRRNKGAYGTAAGVAAGVAAHKGYKHLTRDDDEKNSSARDVGQRIDDALHAVRTAKNVIKEQPELAAAMAAQGVKHHVKKHRGYYGAAAGIGAGVAASKMHEDSKEAALEDIKHYAKLVGSKGYQEAADIVGHEGAQKALKGHRREALKTIGRGAAGAAGAVGLAVAAKKLKDKYDEEKKSSLLDYLKAAADGSLTDVGENTADSAAEHDQFAELDLHNRSVNEYLHGVGKTRMPNKGQVYAVEPAPHHDGVHASNVPTNETKSAEFAYVNNFRKVANEYGPYLPAVMPREEKVAHLQTMLGLPPSDRIDYLSALLNG